MSVYPTICLIDDDADYVSMSISVLQSMDLDIQGFTDLHSAAEVICKAKIVLLDLFMPKVDGVEALRWLHQQQFSGILVLISGHDSSVLHATRELAKAHGLQVGAVFTKPVNMSMLGNELALLLQLPGKTLATDALVSRITASDFKKAIHNKELFLCYQPKYQLATQQLCGFEALARWHSPQFGAISPSVFVPLAEKNDLIDELTDWVLTEAISQLAIWQQQTLSAQVSVNLSLKNLRNLGFVARLLHQLSFQHIEPQRLVLEITETALMNEVTTALDILIRLRMNGFQLSIDDFGTGYSSLAQLQKIPFTELKIDRRFVSTFRQEAESQAIVEACILLGHKLNIKTVAEGIEDELTLQAFKQAGCDLAQGYFFHPPLTAVQATELLMASAK